MGTISANALTTLAEIKVQLELTSYDTWDDILIGLINAASDFVERYCGRNFIEQEFTEIVDGKGKKSVFLQNRPITAVESVYDDPDGVFGADTLLESNSYRVDTLKGAVRLVGETNVLGTRQVFYDGTLNVKVVYTAGYEDVDSLPYALKQACEDLVKWKFRNRGKEGISSERLGSYSVAYKESDVPDEIKIALDKFANVNI